MVKTLPNTLDCQTCKVATFTNLNDYNAHVVVCPGAKTTPLNTPMVIKVPGEAATSCTTPAFVAHKKIKEEIDSGNNADDDDSSSEEEQAAEEESSEEIPEKWKTNMYEFFQNGRNRTPESAFRESTVINFFWGKVPNDHNMFLVNRIHDYEISPKSYHSKIKNHVKHFLTSHDGKYSSCMSERAALHWTLITLFLHLPYYLFKKSFEGEYLYQFLDKQVTEYFDNRFDFINSGLKDELILKAKLYDLAVAYPDLYVKLLSSLNDVSFQKALKVTYLEHIYNFKKVVNNFAIKEWNDYSRNLTNYICCKTTNYAYYSPMSMVPITPNNQIQNPVSVPTTSTQDFNELVAELTNAIDVPPNPVTVLPTTLPFQTTAETKTTTISTQTTPVVPPKQTNRKKRVQSTLTQKKPSKSQKVDFSVVNLHKTVKQTPKKAKKQ